MRRDWVYYIDLRLLWKMAASGKENMPKGTAGGDSQKQTCEIAQRRFAAAYGNIDVSVRDSLIFRFRTFHFLSRAYTLGRRTQRTAAFRFSASFDIHEQRITNISSVSFRLIIYLYRNNTSVGRNFNDSASRAAAIYPGWRSIAYLSGVVHTSPQCAKKNYYYNPTLACGTSHLHSPPPSISCYGGTFRFTRRVHVNVWHPNWSVNPSPATSNRASDSVSLPQRIELSSVALGGHIVQVSDQFFAEAFTSSTSKYALVFLSLSNVLSDDPTLACA